MGNILIPLGGAGGKNRGNVAVLGDSTPFTKTGETVSLPLPAGNYKKSVSNPRANFGDGKNSELTISKGLLKQMAIEAFGIASITNFSAAMYAHKQVRLTWSRPTRGLWSGVHFIFKYGSMPDGIYDGFTYLDTADVHYETRPLQEGLLYIRAYNYVETNQGRWYDYDGTPVYTTIQVTGISGSVTLGAGGGVWTVPPNVYKIRYILVGHGGRGGYPDGYESGGGGGGGYFTTGYMDVTPGQALPWIVPVVPVSLQSYNVNPTIPSYNTKLGDVSATYGRNGMPWVRHDKDSAGGNGGSGGGGPYLNGGGVGAPGGSNGSDGINGSNSSRQSAGYARGGTGQHTSTLGFNGVLYSGGGGGGRADGGAGGGGNGWKYDKSQRFQNGADGTDGLGGGGGGGAWQGSGGGKGGTGCIYIAWGSLMNDGS